MRPRLEEHAHGLRSTYARSRVQRTRVQRFNTGSILRSTCMRSRVQRTRFNTRAFVFNTCAFAFDARAFEGVTQARAFAFDVLFDARAHFLDIYLLSI